MSNTDLVNLTPILKLCLYIWVCFWAFYLKIFFNLFILTALCLCHGTWACHCGGFSCRRAWALGLRLRSCGQQAQLPQGMWNLPRPRIKPVTCALAGGFLTTGPPRKTLGFLFCSDVFFPVLIRHCFNIQSFKSLLMFSFLISNLIREPPPIL